MKTLGTTYLIVNFVIIVTFFFTFVDFLSELSLKRVVVTSIN